MSQLVADGTHTFSYTLPRPESPAPVAEATEPAAGPLPEAILVRNAIWFCGLRWVVVVVLACLGVPDVVADLLRGKAASGWAGGTLLMAGILVLYNIPFQVHSAWLKRAARPREVRLNLWGQILLDLVVLTAVVHFLGSVETFVPFAYLFHVALAAMFFSRRQSLGIALAACGLYASCVIMELSGLLASQGLLATRPLAQQMELAPATAIANLLFVPVVLVGVWYLASELSARLRRRDAELEEMNRRLEAALTERAGHMLRTARELKTPLAAIHANMQLLMEGYCGELSEPVREVVSRTFARCQRLARETGEMLQLGNLRSESEQGPHPEKLDLAGVLRWSLEQLEPQIKQHKVMVRASLRPAMVAVVESHLRMLFSNLLSNAVTYSRDGGRVYVYCEPTPAAGPKVTIEDEGIGIPPEKLPHIFEEYYRTDEAVRHNPQSSGLGLTLVRLVAERHKIDIKVTSRLGSGTKLELQFPA